jgi:integrase
MLYRLVRPMIRSGSKVPQFVQRIPVDVRPRAIGRTLDVPLGDAAMVHIRVTDKMASVRFSLRTRHPAEVKARQAAAAAHLEKVWQALRLADQPVMLSNRHAHALAGELYRAWADAQRESDLAATHDPLTGQWVIDERPSPAPEEEGRAFAAAAHRLTEAAERDGGLEPTLGPLIDRLLLRKGIAAVDPECRPVLLHAFLMALQDAFASRERNAAGDFSPDPNAARFPVWAAPGSKERTPAGSSMLGLVAGWWTEAQARGLKPSTHESYRNTAAALVAFLGHDDTARITPEDILRFKDHRLASVHPRTGRPISAKTVKDSDLGGLMALFGWAVANRKLQVNPAAGITIKLGKVAKLRSKSFTDAEAVAILSASLNYRPGRAERVQTAAAKRWVPWLCAYTGARVGEMVQLRRQDVRQVGALWVLTITPEAGTVKTNEAREVVLHSHLVEQGFPEFATNAPAPYLFLRPAKDDDVLGPWQGVKNRLQVFARSIVTDRNVAPNHGWRHRFKTVGMEAGIPPRILDAIQGQAPRTVADGYGEVNLRTQAQEIARLPRIEVAQLPLLEVNVLPRS